MAKTDARPPARELLDELAKLGVDVTMLQKARLSEDELRELLSSLKRLSRTRERA